MTRKPLRKARTAPKKPTRRPAKRAVAKPAKRAKPSKSVPATRSDPLDRLIDAAAQALALPVEDAWRPAIAANLRVSLEHAASVEAFALADDAEPAPIFTA
jgi:methylphosphotriester-DNA--protein-cysteine methyltransferase